MNNRIKLIRKELELTQKEFADALGMKKSSISMMETGKSSLTERNKNLIIQKFNINPVWMESGIGEMFSHVGNNCQSKPLSELSIEKVPLYNINSTTGMVSLLSNSDEYTPIDYIYIPNLPKCDGAIHITGDIMYPLLNSGDIVLYKSMENIDQIYWGYMYLISIDQDGEEFITVQYIKKSDIPGCIRLSSENKRHSDIDIQQERILGLAFVKATIRMNTAK